MRQQFINTDYCTTYTTTKGTYIDRDFDEFDYMPGIVLHDCPWAECCLEADGGLIAFESYQDFIAFKKNCE